METASWVFDEEPHRAVLPELRMWVEAELHQFSIGRFAAGSKRHRRLALLAQAHDQYDTLFHQVVTGQLIDSVTRRVNGELSKENESFVTENKQIANENKQLVTENKFLCKEATYYKLTLDDERRVANKFFSWAPDHFISRMKGGRSS